jgi:hypothetical protein
MENNLRHSRINQIIFYGILILLVFAPLALGSVHVWAHSLLKFGVFTLLALWFAQHLIVSRSKILNWVKTPLNLWLLLLGMVGLQLLPLPASVVSLVSPYTLSDKRQAFTILARATDVTAEGPAWMTLAYYHHAAVNELLKLAAYGGMFFLVINTLNSRKRIDILIYSLFFLGLFEALYAIYQVITDNPIVWWWVSRFGRSQRASGTFIGTNHFAAYLGMVVCLTFGFLIAQKEKAKDLTSNLGGLREQFQKIRR